MKSLRKQLSCTALGLLALPALARAESLCETVENIRPKVTYCDENMEFEPYAEKCVKEYQALLASEKKRIEEVLNARVEGAADSAQATDFATTQSMLQDALDDLTYLIDYGKQVHTELEDYQFGMVPPVYEPEQAKLDPWDPKVRKEFLTAECYGPPNRTLEGLELQLRPMIEDLEKTKAKVVTMRATTGARQAQIQNSDKTSLVRGVNRSAAAGAGKAVPNGQSANRGSTITGKIKNERLPAGTK